MSKIASAFILFLLGAASWAVAAPAEKTIKSLTVGNASVGLEWSTNWQIDPDAPGQTANSVRFRTADALKMMTYLTRFPKGDALSTDEGIREFTSELARDLATQTVEKEIEVQHMAGQHARGYYVCVTDKAPKAGEYKYMCQGMVNVDGSAFLFNVLYNEPGMAEAHRVLAAFKTLQLSMKA